MNGQSSSRPTMASVSCLRSALAACSTRTSDMSHSQRPTHHVRVAWISAPPPSRTTRQFIDVAVSRPSPRGEFVNPSLHGRDLINVGLHPVSDLLSCVLRDQAAGAVPVECFYLDRDTPLTACGDLGATYMP